MEDEDRVFSEREVLIHMGWKTADQIIKEWNQATQASEHPTIAGQMLARMGLHTQGTLRTPKVPGKPCLYSPTAQGLIRDALHKRAERMRSYAARYSA